ncbi:hypothetical protein HMPREF9134_00105 [Porphyromonas catoniae F0037]|uniref:Uncharacterized protein n=1 Tax=Porphyromonas catoniae F0037 TaxID=1127696 RepID=L1NIQ4_9PORP|nr:hypothetical protein HMPREF9134_00105 [Porphyromonas catoniae F0037]
MLSIIFGASTPKSASRYTLSDSVQADEVSLLCGIGVEFCSKGVVVLRI